jgi:hypothetical protein
MRVGARRSHFRRPHGDALVNPSNCCPLHRVAPRRPTPSWGQVGHHAASLGNPWKRDRKCRPNALFENGAFAGADETCGQHGLDVTEEEKRARLSRMRLVALAVLAAMLAVFAASSMWQGSIPALQWLRAFSEAGIAGAIADWYAVVALFRHPLGLPMPHTAIIPRNKDRIADSIGLSSRLIF